MSLGISLKSSTITKAADIVVFEPNTERTVSTELNTYNVGATVIAANKGRVGEVFPVYLSNFREVLGGVLPKSDGDLREGLYHIADALDFPRGSSANGCPYVNVVRVVPSDAKFPTISMADAGTITTDAETYGTSITAGTGTTFVIYPVDGDPSTKRKVGFSVLDSSLDAWETSHAYTDGNIITDPVKTPIGWYLVCTDAHTSASDSSVGPDYDKFSWTKYGVSPDKFDVIFYDEDAYGNEYELERHTVSIKQDAKDAMGRDAFIQTVLERDSTRFRCVWNETATDWATISPLLTAFTKTTFVGGTNGTLSTLTDEDWKTAWDKHRNPHTACDLMFMAGQRNMEIVQYVAGITKERRARLFADLNPNSRWQHALNEQMQGGVDSRFVCMMYCPVSANDLFSESRAVWGASGAAACAKAKANAIYTGKMPGVHRAIAQSDIAYLGRTGIKFLYPEDIVQRETAVDARINCIIPGDNFGAMIGDALTCYWGEDYLRFQWVNDICSYIEKRYVYLAMSLKFKPTQDYKRFAENGIRRIMDECVAGGYLVTPRNPADGTAPYGFRVVEEDIDLMVTDIWFCPAGVARRQAMQPIILR